MKIVAFVPIKLNSERLPRKNIKSFDNGNPLITYILETLMSVDGIDDIYVYCSTDEICKYLPKGVKFLQRDVYYDLSTTSFNEVLSSFANIVYADYYLLTHATAPFISKETFEKAIRIIKKESFDSVVSVREIKEFLWKNNKPINYSLGCIPRTQDIEPLFVETCGLYLYSRETILNRNRRIGDNPYLLPVSKVEALDINDSIDFDICNAVFNFNKKGKRNE